MSGAWGTKVIDSVEIIDAVWTTAPAGSDGDTVEGLTLRLPKTGERARPGDVGKRFDGARPAAVIVTLAKQADDALLRTHVQFLEWESDLVRFGPDVYRVGTNYLSSGWQALRLIHATHSYTHLTVIKICNAAALGATDITTPEAFADSAYSLRNTADPTRALLWVDAEGNRKKLSNPTDYGALVVERPFRLPTTWRA